ncbi:hypothetical protein ACQ4PT_042520 [Festuca glaucescens]
MKAASQQAYEWVEELVPSTWIKAFFSDFPKCDMLLNNHSEVFNSYILQAREMVVLSMLETIFYKLMQRVETKQEEAEKWPGTICPKIKKKLDKFTEWSATCRVKSTGNGLYHVESNEIEISYVVDLPGRSCDCKRWQLSGIPCHHAIACYHNKKGHDKYIASIQVEQNEAREPEDVEFDDPSYIQNIMPQRTILDLDPMHQQNSMVYKLGVEERAHVAPNRAHGPLPQESSFVQAARESIPQTRVRVTTATSRGNLRGRGRGRNSTAHVSNDDHQPSRGRGRGRNTTAHVGDDGQQPSSGQGRGKRKKPQANSSCNVEIQEEVDRGAGRARGRGSYATGPGSAYYLLFGDGGQPTTIPDLNAHVLPDLNAGAEEVPVTHNAPTHDDV